MILGFICGTEPSLCRLHYRIVYLQLIAGDKEGEYAESAGVTTNIFLENTYKAYEDRYSVKLQEDDEKAKRTVFRLTVKGE